MTDGPFTTITVEEYNRLLDMKEGYAKGFSDAREKAAKIASDHPADENGTDVCRAIEWKIRAMESDQ